MQPHKSKFIELWNKIHGIYEWFLMLKIPQKYKKYCQPASSWRQKQVVNQWMELDDFGYAVVYPWFEAICNLKIWKANVKDTKQENIIQTADLFRFAA